LYKQIEELHLKESLSKKNNQQKDVTLNPHPPKKTEKIGRNQLCMCGSGKKYKKCHGAKE
jgi:preprotein translocase subunit SecA